MSEIRNGLIKAGVANLNEFGYPDCSTDNLLTDKIYSQFFKSMLEDSLGHDKGIDEIIEQLISEIEAD